MEPDFVTWLREGVKVAMPSTSRLRDRDEQQCLFSSAISTIQRRHAWRCIALIAEHGGANRHPDVVIPGRLEARQSLRSCAGRRGPSRQRRDKTAMPIAARGWQVTNMIDLRRTHRKIPPKRRHLSIVDVVAGGHDEMRPPVFLTFLLG